MKQVFLIVIAGLVVLSCNNTGKLGGGKDKAMETQLDSISYAIGLDLGKNLKSTGLEVNSEMILAGINSTWEEGAESALSEEDKRRMLVELQNEIRKKQMEDMAAQGQQPNQPQQPQMPSKFSAGTEVPEISLPTPDGEVINLTDLRGKYVMIDFWASWCKPCRAENPNVVRVYNKYKDQGFEILGVSLDRDRNAWLQAIQQDGLTWKHVSDLKFWQSEAAQAYGINAIPYTVLLDKEGKVLVENLRGASLDAKLGELFGN